jgi:ABC-2 type transport system ATP-binding protein
MDMVIRVEDVTKKIKGNTVLEHVNLELQSGNIYGIVGQNGSGKTMLLRAIAGLIQPTSGTVYIDDKQLQKDISFPPEMGLLIEKPEVLDYLSGMDNLMLLAGIRNLVSREEIADYMKQFALDADSKKTVKKYSLGMKQKIGIIQAIMENPKLLVLDEPFNALDEATVKMLYVMFQEYKQAGKLIILTSHHKEDIETLCDKIIMVQEGHVAVNEA